MPAPRRAATLAAAVSLVTGGLAVATVAPAAAVPGAASPVFVNEINYDTPGTDAGEFVEVAGPAGTDLSGWSVVLYNGNGGASYATTALSGTIPAQGGGYGAVSVAAPGIQNGAPDGVALVNGSGVVQFLSYEGSFAATGGPASGQTSTDVGVAQTGSEAGGETLQLTGTGTTAGDFTWSATAAGTPGQPNAGQAFGDPGAQPLVAGDQADVTTTVDEPMEPVTLQASGGTAPYGWEVTGLPAGVSETSDGVLGGTPTEAGTSTVTATVSDSATPAASDTVTFDLIVEAAPEPTPIAEIQGTGDASPLAGQTVTTSGVVTAVYATGGKNGFVIQTPGAQPGAASHGLFVFTFNGTRAGLVAEGDTVEVTGPVSEYNGLTELTAGANDDIVVTGTGTVTPAPVAWPRAEADREPLESMLLDLSGQTFTVSDNYSTNRFGEVGLATGDRPLITPTEVAHPTLDAAEYDAVVADNAARGLLLDDGASVDYTRSSTASSQPLPWLDRTITASVGATATLTAPVVLDYGFGAWRVQPTSQVTGVQPDLVTFEDTRDDNATPQDVGGDLTIATFNVLNYFNTTGADWVGSGRGTCTYYTDRAGDEVTNNRCEPNGPRGAAEADDLDRQQAKIVEAINTLDASVVSLEEIENSAALGEADRDDALAALTGALNAAAGEERWEFVPSPADLPASEDVIRTAFIYDPSVVELEGESAIFDDEAFSNARQPLAQAFRPVGTTDAQDAFAVVVNHFKSKGSACAGEPEGPQGNCNESRIAQAKALAGFADGFAADGGFEKVYLTGDFNSYTEEDPMLALERAGYTQLESDTADEWSYSFDGASGSLDHVLANDAALAEVEGVDIWEINATEAIAYEYSRHNYNVTDFYAADVFRASDHNPELVGIDIRDAAQVDLTLTPSRVKQRKETSRATVTIPGATGEVTFTVAGETTRVGLVDGVATLRIGPFDNGSYEVVVDYAGDADTLPGSDSATLVVGNGRG